MLGERALGLIITGYALITGQYVSQERMKKIEKAFSSVAHDPVLNKLDQEVASFVSRAGRVSEIVSKHDQICNIHIDGINIEMCIRTPGIKVEGKYELPVWNSKRKV